MDKHGVSEEFQVFLLIYIQQINKTSALESWHLEALFNICKKNPDFKATPGAMAAMAKAPERLELDPEQPKFLLLAPQPQASQASQARMFSVESLMKHQLKLRETVVETSHIP